jgi:hypothetical protein
MDDAQLNKWKQLANDAVIAMFGTDTRESQLAQALEQAVDILNETSNSCPRCSKCDDHGNVENEDLEVSADDVAAIYNHLSKLLTQVRNAPVDEVKNHLDSMEESIDELGELVSL